MISKKIINYLKSAKVIEKPTHGWVYTHNELAGNSGYFAIDEIDSIFDCDSGKPCFLFDCDKQEWEGINIDNAIENELEDWYDGAIDGVNYYDELDQFIKQWNAKQTLGQYFANFGRIIVLDQVEFNALLNTYRGDSLLGFNERI